MEDSLRINLIGKGLAWENVTKAKTNSAGNALLEIAPRVAAMEADIKRLRTAIRQTLDENGHLADGDNCTLIALKMAIETPHK